MRTLRDDLQPFISAAPAKGHGMSHYRGSFSHVLYSSILRGIKLSTSMIQCHAAIYFCRHVKRALQCRSTRAVPKNRISRFLEPDIH